MKFIDYLQQAWRQTNSLVCVGIDPDSGKIPPTIMAGEQPFYHFGRRIIDAVVPYICACKPQIAHFAARAAEAELELLIRYIKQNYPHLPVILDAKRGDIGSTAEMYAIEAFDRYQADAVTVNPYLGGDTLEPFLRRADKGVFVLCRTSNLGSGDFQNLMFQQKSLSAHVADRAVNYWNDNQNVGLVAGATWPQEISALRVQIGTMPLLIPGIGAQGGDLEQVLSAGLNADGNGLLINVSRSVIYAGEGHDFADAAGAAAGELMRSINHFRHQ